MIYLLEVLKNEFVHFDEAIFQGVDLPFKLIWCFMCIEKSDFDEVACDALSRRMGLTTHNLPSGRSNKRL
jgi:hypothetical protein